MTVIRSLDEAVAFFDKTMAERPERDGLTVWESAAKGMRRKYPAIYINHLATRDDTSESPPHFVLLEVDIPATQDDVLAEQIVGMLAPLDMLNPVKTAFGLGRGTGTMVTCFGIPLNPDAGDAPAHTRTLNDMLNDDIPDARTAGLVPEIIERIDLIKSRLPSRFKIALPDMQGPYNIAHAILGEEALLAPILEPDRFCALMARVTDLWISARKLLIEEIGPAYACPSDQSARIAECSVNLVSADFYCEHILPHDRRISNAFGALHIHPCGGPHVFHTTLDALPVTATEAGLTGSTASGATGVDEALEAIGDRPILLHIGQELPEGEEETFIQHDLDQYADNARLLFSYTGMHWRKKDRPMIREMHTRLDAYWSNQYC